MRRHVDDVRAEGPGSARRRRCRHRPAGRRCACRSRRAQRARNSTISSLVSPGACQATSRPPAIAARRAFAPRRRGRPPRDSPTRRASSSPPLSATPSQDLVPTPVVSTMTSTVPASRSVVARVVTLTSSRATVRSTGPWTTSAPRSREHLRPLSGTAVTGDADREAGQRSHPRRGWRHRVAADVSARTQAARLQLAGGWRRVSAGRRRARGLPASSRRRCCTGASARGG